MRAETIKKLEGSERDELYRACETCARWAAALKAGNACLMGGMGISGEGAGRRFGGASVKRHADGDAGF